MADGSQKDLSRISPEDYDKKWHFVPPAGERPVANRWGFLAGVLVIMLIEFFFWGIYRWTTASYLQGFGTTKFYLMHIVAAPLINFVPILLYWKFYRKEKMFIKADKDGDTYTGFTFGPVKFTKRLLLTAVIVGLIGGIVWRVAEMMVGDTVSIMMGGSQFGKLNIFNIYSTEGFGVFLLMTFVMFFIVGPIEEFEFRSFVNDQSARVLPMWQALIFSSVLFGLSHTPIAIFVYKFTPAQFAVQMFNWMAAGVVLGILYVWSRNILASVIMHAIGNWQLSTFLLQSTTKGVGLGDGQILIAQVIVTIVADAIVIGLFYVIYKFYWEPQRRGEPAFGGKLIGLQKALFAHDVGTGKTGVTASILTVFTIVTLLVLAGGVNVVGTKDFARLGPQEAEKDTGGSLTGLTENVEMIPVQGQLGVGESQTQPIDLTGEKLIRSLNATLTWTDEPDMRRFGRTYTNQPETFSLTITGPNVTATQEGTNAVHEDGQIDLAVTLTDEQILGLASNATFDVTVTLVTSGMYSPRLGVIGFNDNVNTFDMTITVTSLEKKTDAG